MTAEPKCICIHDHEHDCPKHGTNAWKNGFAAGAASMKERAAKLEPEPPAKVKGRVMSEWWWRGIMAMHREIKALSDLEE